MADFETVHDALDHTGLTGVGAALANNLIVGTSMPPVPYSALTEKVLVASRVHYQRFLCLSAVTVTTVYFNVNVQNGNLDIGIYNAALDTKLGSTGSFACPATGNRSQALTGSVALTAGTIYYFAHATDSATFKTTVATIGPTGLAIVTGGWNTLGQENSTFPLPTTPSVTWEQTTNWPIYFFK